MDETRFTDSVEVVNSQTKETDTKMDMATVTPQTCTLKTVGVTALSVIATGALFKVGEKVTSMLFDFGRSAYAKYLDKKKKNSEVEKTDNK